MARAVNIGISLTLALRLMDGPNPSRFRSGCAIVYRSRRHDRASRREGRQSRGADAQWREDKPYDARKDME
jgi:hypothetical protein